MSRMSPQRAMVVFLAMLLAVLLLSQTWPGRAAAGRLVFMRRTERYSQAEMPWVGGPTRPEAWVETNEVAAFLRKSQFPEDCSKAKFMVYDMPKLGDKRDTRNLGAMAMSLWRWTVLVTTLAHLPQPNDPPTRLPASGGVA